MIKYYTFYRENNNFNDILKDPNIKKVLRFKMSWNQHLMVGIKEEGNEREFSYITLKYGEDMKSMGTKDRTPIAGVDYVPKKDKTKFVKESP